MGLSKSEHEVRCALAWHSETHGAVYNLCDASQQQDGQGTGCLTACFASSGVQTMREVDNMKIDVVEQKEASSWAPSQQAIDLGGSACQQQRTLCLAKACSPIAAGPLAFFFLARCAGV